MKNKIILFIALFCNTVVFAQWNSQSSGTVENLNEVIFQNDNTGYICGNSGVILKTTNAGSNWGVLNSAVSSDLTSISINPGNNNYVLAVGKTSKLLLTTNAGSNWTNIPVTPVDFMKVRHADIFNAYICGTQGRVLFSSTAGATWNIVPVAGVDTLFALAVLSPTTAVVAGEGADKIYRTTNSGVNWTVSPTGVSSLRTVRDLFFQGPLTGYALVNSGEILKTVNGGVTWFSYGTVFGSAVNAYRLFIVGSEAYMSVKSGSQGAIIKNYEAGSGMFWYQQETSFVLFGAPSFMFTSAATGYAVSGIGNIYKTTNSGGSPIGITNTSSEIPEKFSLSQNYPNPFNPETNIEFAVPYQSHVKLAIYDNIGREVSLLADEFLSAGVYKVNFNAGNLTSGVYFYRLMTKESSLTKKMMLIK